MRFWQARRQTNVSFVLENQNRSGFGHAEIYAANADVGLGKLCRRMRRAESSEVEIVSRLDSDFSTNRSAICILSCGSPERRCAKAFRRPAE